MLTIGPVCGSWYVYLDSGGIHTGNNCQEPVSSSGNIATGAWHHVAVIQDGSNANSILMAVLIQPLVFLHPIVLQEAITLEVTSHNV